MTVLLRVSATTWTAAPALAGAGNCPKLAAVAAAVFAFPSPFAGALLPPAFEPPLRAKPGLLNPPSSLLTPLGTWTGGANEGALAACAEGSGLTLLCMGAGAAATAPLPA